MCHINKIIQDFIFKYIVVQSLQVAEDNVKEVVCFFVLNLGIFTVTI